MKQEFTLEEALTGGKVTIEHLNGRRLTISLSRRHILKPNEVLVIGGLGLPDINSSGNFGKLFLLVNVKIPTYLEEGKRQTLLNVSVVKEIGVEKFGYEDEG